MTQPSVSPQNMSDHPEEIASSKKQSLEAASGTLYVVGTPIGNLEDMTFRAVRILRQVDVIAAEDTRHTGKLLHHFQIGTPQISYHTHNHHHRVPELLQRLQSGQAIALVSDAGMPSISDPGYDLVRACRDAGFPVSPIPGPSAGVTALSAAGLSTDRFVFEGFLPAKGRDRRDRIAALTSEPRTVILYEAPHRLRHTLNDLTEALGGDRILVVARELTKRYEEFWEGNLAAAVERYTERNPQGEFTLILTGAATKPLELSDADIKAELMRLLSQGMSHSNASRQLAQQAALPRRHVYQLALSLKETQ
ncbi:MAG: 16S rRNA (cytidine(1402)-2'-O)-methyltransferase [Elainellaceae cyanobacterium]